MSLSSFQPFDSNKKKGQNTSNMVQITNRISVKCKNKNPARNIRENRNEWPFIALAIDRSNATKRSRNTRTRCNRIPKNHFAPNEYALCGRQSQVTSRITPATDSKTLQNAPKTFFQIHQNLAFPQTVSKQLQLATKSTTLVHEAIVTILPKHFQKCRDPLVSRHTSKA